MAKKFTQEEIYQKDIYKDLVDSNKAALDMAKLYNQEIVKTHKLLSTLSKDVDMSASGLRKLTKANEQSKKSLQEKSNTEKQILKIEKELAEVTVKQRERLNELRLERSKANKVAKQAVLINKALDGEYKKQSTLLIKLKKEYKDQILVQGKATVQTEKLRKRILALDRNLNKLDSSLGDNQRRVGNYIGAIRKLMTVLSQLGLGLGVFQLIKSATDVIVGFDSAIAELGAVSGKTLKQLKPLTDQAKELGATTQFTAREITSLQIELSKLGFTMAQIMDSTGPISRFATATGADIPEAAQLAGSALRAFQLDAKEMERVVSVLAVATTKTGLNFGFLQTALSTVAPVANAFGFSIEETTALLGQLANSGFDASAAATATRNILLNLADTNGDLAQKLGRTVSNSEELSAALIELQSSGVNLAESLALTDKRSVAAFNTFLKGAGTLNELKDSITDVSGELQIMSDKRLDTIKGATDLLKSAWEGLIIEWTEGNGIIGKLKGTLLFLADNLGAIVKVSLTVLKIWALQRIATKLFRIEVNKLGKSVASGIIPTLGRMGRAMKLLASSFRLGTLSVKRFSFALKRVPLVAVIALLTEAVFLFFEWGSATEEVADETAQLEKELTGLNKVNKETNEQLTVERAKLTAVFEALKATKNGTEERKKALDKVNKDYGITLKNLSDEEQFVSQLGVAYSNLINQIENKIRARLVEAEVEKLLIDRIKLEDKIQDQQFSRARRDEQIAKDQLRILAIQKEIQSLEASRVLTGDPILDEQENRASINRVSELNEELVRLNDLLSLKDTEVSAIDQINLRIQELLSSVKDPELEIFVPETKEDKKKFEELNEFKKQKSIELAELEFKLRQQGVRDEDLDQFLADKRFDIALETSLKIRDLDFDDKNILAQSELVRIRLAEESETKRVELHAEAIEQIIDLNDLLALDSDDKADREARLWAKIREEIVKTTMIAEEFGKRRNAALETQAKLQGQIADDAANRQQQLIGLAKERSLTSTESIAEEKRRQTEALTAQQNLLDKQKETEAIITALKLLAARAEAGDGNPIKSIESDFLQIKGLVEGFFIDGTDTTVGDSLGYKSQVDGHIIAADSREAIFNPQQTAALGIRKGGRTTQDVVDLVKYGMTGESVSMGLDKVALMYMLQGHSLTDAKLDQLIANTMPQRQPQDTTTFDVASGILEYTHNNGVRKTKTKLFSRR